MYRVEVSKETIRNHFHYDKWKYVLGIFLSIFTWSLLATVTAPQTPPEKKVDLYLVGGFMIEEPAAEYAETMLVDFPELWEINFYNIMIEGEMEYMGRQKLMIMTGSQTGDIYIFKKDEFDTMASLGAFIPLDDYPEITRHFTKEQLEEFTYTTDLDPEPRIYGVPVSDVDPIGKSFFNTEDAVIGVMAYSQNMEKSIEVMQWIIEHSDQEAYQQKRLKVLETEEQ